MQQINSKYILDNYNKIFLDIYGVIHNGIRAFDGAVKFLQDCKKNNIPTILVSNAPRLSNNDFLINKLNNLGVIGTLYDKIITSGDIFIEHMKKTKTDQKMFIIKDDAKDSEMIDKIKSLHIKTTTDISECKGIIGINIPQDKVYVNNIINYFDKLIEKSIIMHSVNPDLYTTNNDGEKIYHIGYIASLYEARGGKIIQYGKPNKEIFSKVKKLINKDEKTIFIGDSINTDIIGVNKWMQETHSCLIMTGNSNEETLKNLKNDIEKPRFIMNHF